MLGLRSFELAHTLPMICFRNSNVWLAGTSCWHLWTGATPLLISCHPSTITLLLFSSPPSTVHIHLPKRYHHFPLRLVTLKPYQPLGLCHPVFAAPKIVVERVRKEYILLHSTIPAWLSYQIQALICGNLRRTPRAAEVDWNYTSRRILKTSPTSYDAAFCDSLNTQTRLPGMLMMLLDMFTSW